MDPTKGVESHIDNVKIADIKCLFLMTFIVKIHYGQQSELPVSFFITITHLIHP